MQHDIAANAMQTLAHQKGIPEEEIRKELALAISCAMKNEDPKAQDFWQHLSFEGNEPTIEEIIDYILMDFLKQNHS